MQKPLHDRPAAFYDSFERKSGDHSVTHYCPGCGHGNVHKYVAEALEDLGVADRTIFVNPVGCSVFAYYYLDIGHIQAPHGRAPAVATAVKRARPGSIVLCYQGDGDLAAIGGNEIIQAANRGEDITVIFINNALYGMTGGQMAPTTLIGQTTTTTPQGRAAAQEGYPIRVCELLAALEAPVYLERVALGDAKNDMRARKAIRKAIQNQVEGKGFSLVEVLSPCPTGWKRTPPDAARFVLETMTRTFPLGLVRERKPEADTPARSMTGWRADVAIEKIPSVLGLVNDPRPKGPTNGDEAVPFDSPRSLGSTATSAGSAVAPGAGGEGRPTVTEERFRNPRIKAAGFGGQGVLFLGSLIAEAGMLAGYGVSWLPSYGPEMRGGTAHCHVTISDADVDSPLVTRSTVLFAFNRPSFEKFVDELVEGGLVIYDSSLITEIPKQPASKGVELIGIPATQIAESVGAARVANLVALGAYVARTGVLDARTIETALSGHTLKPEAVSMNMRALARGMEFMKERR